MLSGVLADETFRTAGANFLAEVRRRQHWDCRARRDI